MRPQTLEEAIRVGIMMGPLSEVQERSYQVIREFIVATFDESYDRRNAKVGGALSMKDKEFRDAINQEMVGVLHELIKRENPATTGGET